MKIIKHRRNNPHKLNKNDLVEIDVNYYLNNLYVTHDPETSHCISVLEDYLRIAMKKEVELIVVDMKTKKLEEKIIKELDKSGIPGFVFDLNNYQIDLKYKYSSRVPIMLNEDNPFLESFEPKEWIWLHTLNKDIDFLVGQYNRIRKKSKYVGICFSGINKMKKKELGNLVLNIKDDSNTYICTDNWGDFNDSI